MRAIIADVRTHGDRALFELTLEFDRVDLAKVGLRVTQAEIDAAGKPATREALAALKLARDRIEAYHRRQKPTDDRFTDAARRRARRVAGPRSRRSGSTCRAAPRPIRRRC